VVQLPERQTAYVAKEQPDAGRKRKVPDDFYDKKERVLAKDADTDPTWQRLDKRMTFVLWLDVWQPLSGTWSTGTQTNGVISHCY
jgi:hypothetical protein